MVVAAPARSADQRAARRRRLAEARLAEQREGVWLRPDNLVPRPDPDEDPDLVAYTAVPDGDPTTLAASLWDLPAWASRAEALCAELTAHPTAGPDDLAPGFVLAASVVRHLVADPLLPAALSPAGWPGAELRSTYAVWDRRYRRALRAWGRTVQPA